MYNKATLWQRPVTACAKSTGKQILSAMKANIKPSKLACLPFLNMFHERRMTAVWFCWQIYKSCVNSPGKSMSTLWYQIASSIFLTLYHLNKKLKEYKLMFFLTPILSYQWGWVGFGFSLLFGCFEKTWIKKVHPKQECAERNLVWKSTE